jgi:hypothetical protein
MAGICGLTIVTPVEHLRIRMQVEGTKKVKEYTGSIDAGIKIYKQHGMRGLQKGITANIFREIVFYGCFFYFYEMISQRIADVDPATGEL